MSGDGQIPAQQIKDFAAEVAAVAPGGTVDYGSVLPDPATYDDGSLFVLTSADPDPLPASAITVDDSGFTQLVGTDVQTVLDNIDSAGVGGGGTCLVPATTTESGTPTLVWDTDDSLITVEVSV